MSRDQLSWRCRRLLDRLNQPSSAAGLAALLGILLPQLAEHAPVPVDLTLTVVAIGAAIVAMVKCECRDCNGHDPSDPRAMPDLLGRLVAAGLDVPPALGGDLTTRQQAGAKLQHAPAATPEL